MTKPVILTGLRANNALHIGNYLGALLPLVDMAKQKAGDYQVNIFVPDLHSFTTPIDHSQLYEQILNNLRIYVASGLPLDNADVHIYRQSFIPAHSELTWILDCFTGYGEILRMTQFKEKATINSNRVKSFRNQQKKELDKFIESLLKPIEFKNRDSINEFHEALLPYMTKAIAYDIEHTADASLGLLNYPVLMAADILLYNADFVPVGEDQTQHLEFARDIAERMNNKFGNLFIVPKPVKEQHAFFGKEQGLRIRDLVDPSKKMSKSDETGKGVIFLTDTSDAARKKIMSATTDSLGSIAFDMVHQPGISNLLTILALFSGESLDETIAEYKGQTQYGPLKNAVADAVCDFLTDFQSKLSKVNDDTILSKLTADEKLMNTQAGETLYRVQKAIGLRK